MPISHSEQIKVLVEKMNRLHRLITMYEKAIESGVQISYPITIGILKQEIESVKKKILHLKRKEN